MENAANAANAANTSQADSPVSVKPLEGEHDVVSPSERVVHDVDTVSATTTTDEDVVDDRGNSAFGMAASHVSAADSNPVSEAGSGWAWLRRWIAPSTEEQMVRYQQRLSELDQAIAMHPEATSNYVLRGELHLTAGLTDLAVVDFQRALELGTQQLETERWGVITQAMRDRAYDGLNRALRLRARG